MSDIQIKAKLELDHITVAALVREALVKRGYKVKTLTIYTRAVHGDHNQGTDYETHAEVELENLP